MRTQVATMILHSLIAAGCAASTPASPPALPRPAAGELRLSPSDPRLARVGAVDCAGWYDWEEFEDRVSVEHRDDGICVTSRRPIVGKPKPNTGAMTVRLPNGHATRIAATDSAPATFFAYCKIETQIRPVWIHTQTACLPANVAPSDQLVMMGGKHSGGLLLVSFR